MLQLISVAIFCLTLTSVNTVSDLSCEGGDLRTIMVHVRQMQTESVEQQRLIWELQRLINESRIEQERIVQGYNNSEKLNNDKLEAAEDKLKNSEEETAKLRTLIQNLLVRINASESEQENQQNLISALQNRIKVLQQQVNESEAKISDQSLQIKELTQKTNETKIQNEDQKKSLDQVQEELNKTKSEYESLQTYIAGMNLTLQDTAQQVDTLRAPKIRLTYKEMSGRLEVSRDGINWGTVCDDDFDSNDAIVACRMLGYSRAQPIFGSNVTDGTGPIFMDDLGCRGTETSLFDCIYTGWGRHNCGHNEDVGLTCW